MFPAARRRRVLHHPQRQYHGQDADSGEHLAMSRRLDLVGNLLRQDRPNPPRKNRCQICDLDTADPGVLAKGQHFTRAFSCADRIVAPSEHCIR